MPDFPPQHRPGQAIDGDWWSHKLDYHQQQPPPFEPNHLSYESDVRTSSSRYDEGIPPDVSGQHHLPEHSDFQAPSWLPPNVAQHQHYPCYPTKDGRHDAQPPLEPTAESASYHRPPDSYYHSTREQSHYSHTQEAMPSQPGPSWPYEQFYPAEPTIRPSTFGHLEGANGINVTPPNGYVNRTNSNESVDAADSQSGAYGGQSYHPAQRYAHHLESMPLQSSGYMQDTPAVDGIANMTGDTGHFRPHHHDEKPYMELRIPEHKRKFSQE